MERADLTLKRYKSPYSPSDAPPLLELWDKFAEWKRPQLSASTVQRDHRKTRNHLLRLPTQSIDRAIEIRNWLGANLSPDSARRVLTQIKAATRWANEEGLINGDPFIGLAIRERKRKGETRSPFTPSERDLILAKFGSIAPHYLPYVRFLFLTGCRTSEANGLLWEDVDLERGAIRFCRVVIEGGEDRGGLKTQTARTFPINSQLRELLSQLPREGDRVFVTPRGFTIDSHNFLNKIWKPLVKSLPIPYRPQYATRHTFITLCLSAGVDVAAIAAWVGNSPKTIYSHYAGPSLDAPPEF